MMQGFKKLTVDQVEPTIEKFDFLKTVHYAILEKAVEKHRCNLEEKRLKKWFKGKEVTLSDAEKHIDENRFWCSLADQLYRMKLVTEEECSIVDFVRSYDGFQNRLARMIRQEGDLLLDDDFIYRITRTDDLFKIAMSLDDYSKQNYESRQ